MQSFGKNQSKLNRALQHFSRRNHILNPQTDDLSIRFFNLQVMEEKPYHNKEGRPNLVSETFVPYEKQEEHEAEMRRRAILMTDMEKFLMFTKMLRRGIMFKNAIITHKPLLPDKE